MTSIKPETSAPGGSSEDSMEFGSPPTSGLAAPDGWLTQSRERLAQKRPENASVTRQFGRCVASARPCPDGMIEMDLIRVRAPADMVGRRADSVIRLDHDAVRVLIQSLERALANAKPSQGASRRREIEAEFRDTYRRHR